MPQNLIGLGSENLEIFEEAPREYEIASLRKREYEREHERERV
jgi:hypothetical protein